MTDTSTEEGDRPDEPTDPDGPAESGAPAARQQTGAAAGVGGTSTADSEPGTGAMGDEGDGADARANGDGDATPSAPATGAPSPARAHRPVLGVLALGALGVVFGDIGTSPLYAIRETFHFSGLDPTRTNVLGIMSVVFWSLLLIITLKYLAFVMRADNRGEGGILALTSLVGAPGRRRWTLVLLGLFGCALLYGDGAITPAISVLSAVEGVGVAAPTLRSWVVPLAVAILVGLFAVQRRGTGSIGRVFGPVMVVWFVTLALLGLLHIPDAPEILQAVNPVWAVRFFTENAFTGFLALGSMFLVVTGGEALYADMGHFGRRPISLAWYAVVLPSLLIQYFGQTAMLLQHPERVEQPFYEMAPQWAVLPLTALATAATVIASQALITGVFSLTMQATQLGFLPRIRILHTSVTERGQIYLPAMNWALLAACIALVVGFGSSSALAAAYGLAVTATMVVTTVLFYVVARERFGWSQGRTLALCGLFLVMDVAFLGANLFKVPDGGWFPLVVAGLIFTAMTTWHKGRQILSERLAVGEVPLDRFLADTSALPRVPGTAVYLYSRPGVTPPSLIKNARHNRVIHEQLVILSVVNAEVPHLAVEERSEVVGVPMPTLGTGGGPLPRPPGSVHQVTLHYGYMETPDVDRGLTEGDAARLGVGATQTTYFLGSEHLVATDRPGMALWRERLFATMSRNATPAARWFNLPNDDVMAVGSTVEL